MGRSGFKLAADTSRNRLFLTQTGCGASRQVEADTATVMAVPIEPSTTGRDSPSANDAAAEYDGPYIAQGVDVGLKIAIHDGDVGVIPVAQRSFSVAEAADFGGDRG